MSPPSVYTGFFFLNLLFLVDTFIAINWTRKSQSLYTLGCMFCFSLLAKKKEKSWIPQTDTGASLMQIKRGRVRRWCGEAGSLCCFVPVYQRAGEASCHFGGEQSFFEGTGRQNCISHSLMWTAGPELYWWIWKYAHTDSYVLSNAAKKKPQQQPKNSSTTCQPSPSEIPSRQQQSFNSTQ